MRNFPLRLGLLLHCAYNFCRFIRCDDTPKGDAVLSVRSIQTDRTKPFESNMFSETSRFALEHEEGRVRVDTAAFGPNGTRIILVQSSGHEVDLEEHESITVLLPQAGQLRMQVAASEYRCAPGKGMMFSPNARRTKVIASKTGGLFRATALMIPWARLRDRLKQDVDASAVSTLADGLPIGEVLPSFRRFSELLAYVTGQFDDAPQMSSRAIEALTVLVEEFLADVLADYHHTLADTRRVPASILRVRQAEEIMRARCTEPLSMTEVAAELGVGLRSLQLAFIEARAMGPRDALNRMRLELARQSLLAAKPADTVTTVALDCGFAHLGRFAGAYKNAYGESPAQSLSQARRRFD
jgi:AraC-like DNA-binding protein